MRVSRTSAIKLVALARQEAPVKKFPFLDQAVQKLASQGIRLCGNHNYVHLTKSTFLGDNRGGHSPSHGLFIKLAVENSVPHLDMAEKIGFLALEHICQINRKGNYDLGNLIILASQELTPKGAWKEEDIKTLLPQLTFDQRVYSEEGTNLPATLPTLVEQKRAESAEAEKRKAQIRSVHDRGLEALKREVLPGELDTLLQIMMNPKLKLDAFNEVLLFCFTHPTKELKPLLLKAWLCAVSNRKNFTDMWGESLLSEVSQAAIMQHVINDTGNSSDDPSQPHDTIGVNVREEAVSRLFSGDFSQIYFEAIQIARLLCLPRVRFGPKEDPRYLSGCWAPGIHINTSEPGGYFRDSVHNQPNKNDMYFLEAIVEYWDAGNKGALEALEDKGLRPKEVYVKPPEQVGAGEKDIARKLLASLKKKYEFADNLKASDFAFLDQEALSVASQYAEGNAAIKFKLLTRARQKLHAVLMSPEKHHAIIKHWFNDGDKWLYRYGDSHNLLANEHGLFAAAETCGFEVLANSFSSINENNLVAAIEFMKGLTVNLEVEGIAVESLVEILDRCEKLLTEDSLHRQGLSVLMAKFSREISFIMDSYQEKFDHLKTIMLKTGEWQKEEYAAEAGYRHFVANFMRQEFLNPLAAMAERVAGFLGTSVLCVPEVEELSLLRLATKDVPIETLIFRLGRSGDQIPQDHLVGKLLLGNKAYNLGLALQHGLPISPALVLTSNFIEQGFSASGTLLTDFQGLVQQDLSWLETRTRKRFGDLQNPLLVSVRPGGPMVIPGARHTILNLGINRDIADNLGVANNRAFAYSTYLNFILTYGVACFGLNEQTVRRLRQEGLTKIASGQNHDDYFFTELPQRVQVIGKQEIPSDPFTQLFTGVEGVHNSGNTRAAEAYRQAYGIPDSFRVAQLIEEMKFGNREIIGGRSGTFALSSHHPTTGSRGQAGFVGDVAWGRQGNAVMSGFGQVSDATEFAGALTHMADTSVEILRAPAQLEITVEAGQPYVLQLKKETLSPPAMLHALVQMADEGIISRKEAVLRAKEIWHLLAIGSFDEKTKPDAVANGIAASAGVASGKIALPQSIEELCRVPDGAIIVAEYLDPEAAIDDLKPTWGILIQKGGVNSHAANVARKENLPCVAGCKDLTIDYTARTITISGQVFQEGDHISIDGTFGQVFPGKLEATKTEVPDHKIILAWAEEEEIFLPKIR